MTDADGFPRWNTTVTRIKGQIREGERLRLYNPNTHRRFTPNVFDVVPNQGMTWMNRFAPMFQGRRTIFAQYVTT